MNYSGTSNILNNFSQRCKIIEDRIAGLGFFNAAVAVTVCQSGSRINVYFTPTPEYRDSISKIFWVESDEEIWATFARSEQFVAAQKTPAQIQKEAFAHRLARLLEESREHGYDVVVPTLETLFETFKSDYHIEDQTNAA